MITAQMSQFIIAVTSSLTTATLFYILRQFVKLRHTAERLMTEHRYLMRSMQMVLSHLGLTTVAKDGDGTQ
jgi:hypothetical protein